MEWVQTAGTNRSFFCVAEIIEESLRRNEGVLADNGAFVALTGERCGLSPRDRSIVEDDITRSEIDWGSAHRPISTNEFDRVHMLIDAWFQARPSFSVESYLDSASGAIVPVRLVADKAWLGAYSMQLFRSFPVGEDFADEMVPWEVTIASDFRFDPVRHGTTSDAAIVIHFGRKRILIAGTAYPGEIDRAMLAVLDFDLASQDVMTIECSSIPASAGRTALLVGDSTANSACGWSKSGLFPIFGGCRRRTDRTETRPESWARFGSVLINVPFERFSRTPNYSSHSISDTPEIAHALDCPALPHPAHILIFVCDESGVLPLVSRLSNEAAIGWLISGTISIAADGRIEAVGGSTRLRPRSVYARILRERFAEHRPGIWLLNIGRSGDGESGRPIDPDSTRAAVAAIVGDRFAAIAFESESAFGSDVPVSCPGIDANRLRPADAWEDAIAYHAIASRLATHLREWVN